MAANALMKYKSLAISGFLIGNNSSYENIQYCLPLLAPEGQYLGSLGHKPKA